MAKRGTETVKAEGLKTEDGGHRAKVISVFPSLRSLRSLWLKTVFGLRRFCAVTRNTQNGFPTGYNVRCKSLIYGRIQFHG